MVEATLKRHEDDVLKLTIGESAYEIPLATTLTPDEANEIGTRDGMIAFFRKYIPAEIADTLKIIEWSDLCIIWKNASEEYAKSVKDAALGDS